MKKRIKQLYFIGLRYIILLVIGLILVFTDIFYKALLPLTIYSTSFILNLFYQYQSFVLENFIIVGSLAIEIIPACVAVSAYFLLLILNLTTPMPFIKRIYSIIFALLAFLIINILRIVILALLFITNYSSFDLIHRISWYVLSIVIVIGIWFLTAYVFKIKSIPAYTDLKNILKNFK
jgi:exosortase/archaeosortase family protein